MKYVVVYLHKPAGNSFEEWMPQRIPTFSAYNGNNTNVPFIFNSLDICQNQRYLCNLGKGQFGKGHCETNMGRG